MEETIDAKAEKLDLHEFIIKAKELNDR